MKIQNLKWHQYVCDCVEYRRGIANKFRILGLEYYRGVHVGKVIRSHYVGKLAEFGVYKEFRQRLELRPPDTCIRYDQEYDWDLQSKGGELSIGVKAYEKGRRIRDGKEQVFWTIQADDIKKIKKEDLSNKWFALTIVDEKEKTVEIKYMLPAEQVVLLARWGEDLDKNGLIRFGPEYKKENQKMFLFDDDLLRLEQEDKHL